MRRWPGLGALGLGLLLVACGNGAGSAGETEPIALPGEESQSLPEPLHVAPDRVERRAAAEAELDVPSRSGDLGDAAGLRSQIAALEDEVATLRASNASLQEELAGAAAADRGSLAGAGSETSEEGARLATQLDATPPGTVLEIGEWWRQGAMAVQLQGCHNTRWCQFRVANLDSAETLVVEPDPQAITAELDGVVVAVGLGFALPTPYSTGPYVREVTPGEVKPLEAMAWIRSQTAPQSAAAGGSAAGGDSGATPQIGLADLVESGAVDFIIHIRRLGDVTDARWRLPVVGEGASRR